MSASTRRLSASDVIQPLILLGAAVLVGYFAVKTGMSAYETRPVDASTWGSSCHPAGCNAAFQHAMDTLMAYLLGLLAVVLTASAGAMWLGSLRWAKADARQKETQR